MAARLRIGIVPLADCAPVVVAAKRGFFAEQGLAVEIHREASWASIRDKVAVGALDGAQMLATMPLSMSLGLAAIRQPVLTACALNLGGNTITLATALCRRMESPDGPGLKRVIDADRAAGRPPMTLAMVYPFATHNYELRGWLAAAGIDPDRDVRLSVVPPPQMVGHLSAGNIAGFCVGEPWGSLAASMGLGRVVATSADVFAGRIEKVLGVTEAWAEAHPDTHLALVRALIAAAAWCDANRDEAAELIARPSCVNVPLEVARQAMARPGLVFHADAANVPWRSHARWYLAQMQRWGHLGAVDASLAAARAYRPDLYRRAALALGLPEPAVDPGLQGESEGCWATRSATATPIAMETTP